MARPAQWPLHDLTLDDLLSGSSRNTTPEHHGQHSLEDVARAHRNGDATAARWDGLPSGGLAAAAATMAVTLTFSAIPTAHSAIDAVGQSAGTASRQPTAIQTPLSVQDQDLASAGLEFGLNPGFTKPAALGRLAEDLPARIASPERVRYAAVGKHKHRATSYSSSRLSGNISTGGKSTGCLPSDLKRALNEAAAKFGHIRITSTSRSHSHNRRVGGAPRSLHLECRAVDFNYHGSRRGALIKFLKNYDGVGGVGVYGSGHIHIDDGPHRRW